MNKEFGLKELYEVSLKATYPIEVNGKIIEIGETIAIFDKIQMASFEERKEVSSSNGGFDNRALVWWEESKEIKISFSQGVFSKAQLALMTNAKLLKKQNSQVLKISCREELETNEEGIVYTKHNISQPVFVYDKNSGDKIVDFTVFENTLQTNGAYKDLVVDYMFEYTDDFTYFNFGQELTSGYLSLEGKTRVKDDVTGHVKTGIVKIPKLKLLSTLSMRLGSTTAPLVGRIDAVAIPTGVKGQKKIMELVFLNDDIDSDM